MDSDDKIPANPSGTTDGETLRIGTNIVIETTAAFADSFITVNMANVFT